MLRGGFTIAKGPLKVLTSNILSTICTISHNKASMRSVNARPLNRLYNFSAYVVCYHSGPKRNMKIVTNFSPRSSVAAPRTHSLPKQKSCSVELAFLFSLLLFVKCSPVPLDLQSSGIWVGRQRLLDQTTQRSDRIELPSIALISHICSPLSGHTRTLPENLSPSALSTSPRMSPR